ncbi:MAG TPA: hypothetical protein VFQ95_00205 [Rhodanobacteraceae bacterium]|nr:hypothetical protein [Rhodanobacteraceae bacterium]
MLDTALETIAIPIGTALCDAPAHALPIDGVLALAGSLSPD